MKIIVNAIPLSNIATGIGRYLKFLYTEIQRQCPDLTIRYFDGKGIHDRLPESPKRKSMWTFAASLAWRLPSQLTYAARITAHHKNAKMFLKMAKGFDLYHEAGYFPFKTSPHVKTVFTLHDLSLKVLPWFHPKDRVLFFQKYFPKMLNHADAIITPSNFTRDEMQRYYSNNAIPIFSIYLGFEKRLFYKETSCAVDALRSKMKLPNDYVLFVGTCDPRKNIRTIFRAITMLPETIKLVVTGWRGWESFMDQKQMPKIPKDRIIFTDYVADQDLAALYSGARVFVYPSFYEGFGFPVLEAMACGCPVICANCGSLPEVAGNAAITCPPEDPVSLAQAIQQIFQSDDLYFEMQLKGIQQAQKFTWEITAKKTLKIFKNNFCIP